MSLCVYLYIQLLEVCIFMGAPVYTKIFSDYLKPQIVLDPKYFILFFYEVENLYLSEIGCSHKKDMKQTISHRTYYERRLRR